MLAGISGVAEVADLAAARHEADECLALHETTSGPTPPAYDESWDRTPAAAAAHRFAVRSVPRPWTGGRAASPRPRQRDRLRGDTAGLAEGPGRPGRGRSAFGSTRKHGAKPATQDGRNHRAAAGRRQKRAGDDDRPCGHGQRSTSALSKGNKPPRCHSLVSAKLAGPTHATMEP